MTRKSNFELLRIIAIIMIIGLHYFNGSMGGALRNVVPGEFNYYFAYLFESLFIILLIYSKVYLLLALICLF